MEINLGMVQQSLTQVNLWISNNPDNSVKPGGVGYFGFNFNPRM